MKNERVIYMHSVKIVLSSVNSKAIDMSYNQNFVSLLDPLQ